MIFGRRMENPRPLIVLGMTFLVLAGVWPRFVHLEPGLGPDWSDAIQGLLYGVSFGVLLWGARLGGLSRRRRT